MYNKNTWGYCKVGTFNKYRTNSYQAPLYPVMENTLIDKTSKTKSNITVNKSFDYPSLGKVKINKWK